jgi:urease accessory protein
VVVGGGRWSELRGGARIAPRVLGPGRLTLVRSQAGPLAGDHDRVDIVVESGTLMIEPVAATVALPGRAQTVLELDIEVSDGARLLLEDAPLVVAEGADVVRTTTIRLGVGAVAIVRDLVVLGRAGEGPGRLESVLRVDGPDGVILHDALRIDPESDDTFVALAPGHRAVGMVCELGVPGSLHGPGSLWRASAVSAADVVAQLDRVR